MTDIDKIENPTVRQIVAEYLKANGYDGLFDGFGCGCGVDDLMLCMNEICMDCRAGYRTPAPEGSDYYFLIGPEKETGNGE